jgi:hypothetical protein
MALPPCQGGKEEGLLGFQRPEATIRARDCLLGHRLSAFGPNDENRRPAWKLRGADFLALQGRRCLEALTK